MTCPQCGPEVTVDRHIGVIEYPAVDGRTGKIIRKTKVGAFWACMRCEWCDEVGNSPHEQQTARPRRRR